MELLVRVKDQVSEDPVKHAQLSKRGDVVVAMPDGWTWGRLELSHDFWRILLVPDLDAPTASMLTASQKQIDPAHHRMLQTRHNRLNLDHASIPADVKAYLEDDSRAQPTLHWPSSLPITIIVEPTQYLDDPEVIGSPSNVIG